MKKKLKIYNNVKSTPPLDEIRKNAATRRSGIEYEDLVRRTAADDLTITRSIAITDYGFQKAHCRNAKCNVTDTEQPCVNTLVGNNSEADKI
jgi:hypothetical protein